MTLSGFGSTLCVKPPCHRQWFRRAQGLTVVFLLLVFGFAAEVAAQPPPGGGQAGPEVRLTLDDAISRAVAASHRVGEFAARRDANDAVVEVARSGYYPQVSALAGYTRTNHVDPFGVFQPGSGFRIIYPDVPDNWRARLDLQWPVYTGGRVAALTRAARDDLAASASDLAAVRSDLRLEVTSAYWNAVTAREAIRVVSEALRRVDAQLADARARLRAGLVPPSDVTQAEARQALQRTLLIEAQSGAESRLIALRRLTGLDQGVPVELVDALTPPDSPLRDVTELVDEARRTRPDRRALEARVASAGARRDAAASGRKPQVFAAAGYDYARPNPRIFPRADEWQDSWDVGVNVALSLFDGGRVRAEVASTDAARRAVEERLAEFDTHLDAEVRQARLAVDTSRASLVSTQEAVRSAAETHRVLRNRYAAGVATSTEVLDAQVVQLQAELELTRAQAQARLDQARLDRALGRE